MPALAERPHRPLGLTWHTRAVSALVLAPIALACVWVGGHRLHACIVARRRWLRPWPVEWLGACAAGSRVGRRCCPAGLAYVVARRAAALLWLRDDPGRRARRCAVPAARRLGRRYRRLSGRALDRRPPPGAAHFARQDVVRRGGRPARRGRGRAAALPISCRTRATWRAVLIAAAARRRCAGRRSVGKLRQAAAWR